MFSEKYEALPPKDYFGADGSPIPRYGQSKVAAETSRKKPVEMSVEVAKVARPLASAGEIVRKNNRVVLDLPESYIQNKRTGYKTPLRVDGNLFYLDLYVKVPETLANDLTKKVTFARRAS